MTFNWKTFQTRTLTAIIFAAVMLTGLLWNHWSFLILFSIIHFGCWWEYLKLTEKICKTEIDKIIKYFFLFCGFILMMVIGLKNMSFDFLITIFSYNISAKWLIWICSFFLIVIFLVQNKLIPQKAKWMSIAGLAYISVSIGLMSNLYGQVEVHLHDTLYVFGANNIPLMIIISIWINDTMAYVVGSLIGKTPLSKISPNKTWEGTIGGVILSVGIIGLVAFFIIKLGVMSIFIMILAAIASIVGTIGDLLESKIKRMADVKDSGRIMPGHGGFLDRFDSLLLAAPAVWVYLLFLMMSLGYDYLRLS